MRHQEMAIITLIMTETYREGAVGQNHKHEIIGTIFHPDTSIYMEYRHLIKDPDIRATWTQSAENEFGCFMEVLKICIIGTKTMKMVHRSNIRKDRKVACTLRVCNYRPHNEEDNRCHITLGRDRVEYPGYLSTQKVDLTTIKCLLNSMLSKLRARFMTADVKNLYLNTPLDRP